MDFNRIYVLLSVIELCAKHGTEYNAIVQEARNELLLMQEHKPERVMPRKAKEPVAPAKRAEPETIDEGGIRR